MAEEERTADCRKCGLTKPLSAFILRPDGKPRKPCTACVVERNRAYRHANPGFVAGRNARRRAKTPPRPTPRERFLAMVHEQGPDECWLWTGATLNGGYGVFGAGGRINVLAHRFAYTAAVGPIPDGMLVCHRCDNPPCVNPAHLFLGTQTDNMRDMVSKGRNKVPNKRKVNS